MNKFLSRAHADEAISRWKQLPQGCGLQQMKMLQSNLNVFQQICLKLKLDKIKLCCQVHCSKTLSWNNFRLNYQEA